MRRELERIFEEPRAADILEIADGLGLLRAIHPALRPAESPEAIEGERGPAMLAGLALGLSPREAEEVSARLNLGAEWARVVRDTAAVRELLGELESDLAPSRVYGCCTAGTSRRCRRPRRRYVGGRRPRRRYVGGQRPRRRYVGGQRPRRRYVGGQRPRRRYAHGGGAVGRRDGGVRERRR